MQLLPRGISSGSEGVAGLESSSPLGWIADHVRWQGNPRRPGNASGKDLVSRFRRQFALGTSSRGLHSRTSPDFCHGSRVKEADYSLFANLRSVGPSLALALLLLGATSRNPVTVVCSNCPEMAVPIWTNPPISHFSSRAVPRSEPLAKEARSRVSGWCGESPKSNARRWRQCGIFLRARVNLRCTARFRSFYSLYSVSSPAALRRQESRLPAPPAQPTPIPITNIAFEAQSALTSLQEIEATVSKAGSRTDAITASLSSLTSEIDPRIAEDTRLLRASPSLDVLYRIKLTWRDLSDDLSALARELSQEVKTLEDEIGAPG